MIQLLILKYFCSARARFAVADSDILTDVNAYEQCMSMLSAGRGHSSVRAFCEEVGVSKFQVWSTTHIHRRIS